MSPNKDPHYLEAIGALKAIKSLLGENGDYSLIRRHRKPLTVGDETLIRIVFEKADKVIEGEPTCP